MKTLLATLLASLTAVSTLSADCGSCGSGEHSDGMASCASGVLPGYYDIQSALADDDLEAAQAAAQQLHDKKADSPCVVDGKECCEAVVKETEAIANASDIAAARAAFHDLSQHMIAHLESHGAEEDVFKIHCPMAFNNEGAAWLQSSKDVENPYFGAKMLKCGFVQKQLDKVEKSHGDGAHHGHDH